MTDTYHHWLDAATAGTYTPLSPERLAEMFTYTRKFGSGNLWTGTTGTLAGFVCELLCEVEHLRRRLNEESP